jgi:predicted phage terminase large subunit-like protein
LYCSRPFGLNVYLFKIVPKGFFPQQDTGFIIGTIQADQTISFEAMRQKLTQIAAIVQANPSVETVRAYTGAGAGQSNAGVLSINLKPKSERSESADELIVQLRGKLSQVPSAHLFLQSVQDIRAGGRASNAQYQYTLQGESPDELYTFVPRLVEALQTSKILADVSSDQQQSGLETDITVDRDTASRLGLVMSQIDNTLYDAFGQRQVSTIYSAINQYHVVMEVDPRYWHDPSILKDFYVSTSGANPSGTATTNAVAGTATQVPSPPSPGSLGAAPQASASQQSGPAAQYQQSPAPHGGAMVKRDWVVRYKELPPVPDHSMTLQSRDTASKGGPDNDWSVCTTWILARGKRWYLVDVWRRRVDYPALEAAVQTQAKRWGTRRVLVEDTGTGTSLVQELRGRATGIIAVKPDGDKASRMAVASAKFEAGQVLLPERAPWLADLEAELFVFLGSRHDDQCDSIRTFDFFQSLASFGVELGAQVLAAAEDLNHDGVRLATWDRALRRPRRCPGRVDESSEFRHRQRRGRFRPR